MYIRCCGNGCLGFRPYGGSLLKSAKVTKTLLPHHLVPRLGSACPHSGIAPWARREGPSMAQRGYPGIHAGMPTHNACVRPAWFNGASRSRSKAKQSKAKQSKARAVAYPASMWLSTAIASKLAPTWDLLQQQNSCTPKTHCGSELARDDAGHPTSPQTDTPPSRASPLPHPTGETRSHQEPGRLSGRLVVDVDLGRPVNHDG